ncbi:MAG: hypothetical protein ACR65T_16420 [Methylocystis sp.]|uniref:hypothetical protein n=1 Tax=Methylocystis sp. TaxID=1911079 RepID=UPI003DA250BB
MTLEQAYYISQILLLGVAFAAAIGAFIQITTFRRFELLKLLEEPRVREARRLIYKKKNQTNGEEWWREDCAERAAAIVCSSFDIVGFLATGPNRRFFARHWWYPICWTYEALEDYLNDRRAGAPEVYEGYTRLYESAKRYDLRPIKAKKNSN